MQKRVAGMASRRASAMGSPQTSQSAVGAVVELGQGPLDLGELVAAGCRQGPVLALLGGHLARVGEVLVEVVLAGQLARSGGAAGRALPPARRAAGRAGRRSASGQGTVPVTSTAGGHRPQRPGGGRLGRRPAAARCETSV